VNIRWMLWGVVGREMLGIRGEKDRTGFKLEIFLTQIVGFRYHEIMLFTSKLI
jgi:hypothetical protein